jgi:acylphosphatase
MKKNYTITSKGRVQQVGFRGYAEDLCRQLLTRAISYNVGEDQMKIVCEAEEDMVDRLCQLLKEYKLAEITEVKIEEGIQLPYSGRVVTALEQELLTRIDSGVRILESMNQKIGLLENMNESINEIKHNTEAIRAIKKDTEMIRGIKKDTGAIKKDTEVLHSMKAILEKIERKL